MTNGSQALSRQSPAADKNEKSVRYGIRNAFEQQFNSEHDEYARIVQDSNLAARMSIA
jgi:hypothetical protein